LGLLNEELLKDIGGNIRKNAAYGVDEVSAKDYELNLDGNIHQLWRPEAEAIPSQTRLKAIHSERGWQVSPAGIPGHAGQTATFDEWMKREHPNNPWARYADDGVGSLSNARKRSGKALLIDLGERFKQCKFGAQHRKDRIVYCKR